jgi:sensor histidine kinase YesM
MSILFLYTVKAAEQPVDKSVTQIIDSLKQQLLPPQSDTLRARTLNRLSNISSNQSNRSALLYAFEALRLSYNPTLSKNERLFIKAGSYDALGLAYERAGKFSRALSYLLLAQEYYKTIHYTNQPGYAKTINTLGHVYGGLKKSSQSESYYKLALVLAKRMGNRKSVASVYSNLGVVYNGRKDFTKSLIYFKLSLKEAEGQSYVYSMASALINLSSTYLALDQLDSAQFYSDRMYELCLSEKNPYHLAVCYINLGKLAMKKNSMKEAERYLLLSKKMALESGIITVYKDVLDALREFYKKNNDFSKALKYHEEYSSLKDSMLNEQVYQTINDAEIASEINKRDRAIVLLNKNKEIADVEIKRETLLRNSLTIGIILAFIICITLYRSVQHKRKTNTVLSIKNVQIENQRQEIEAVNQQLNSFNKELIIENTSAKYEVLKSKTNPHFLFNSMATLSSIVMQDRQLATEYIGRFSELYRRILNTENKSLITLKEEMEVIDYYLYIEKMRFEDKLLVNINIEPEMLEYLVPPFCIQMMVENAIKHNSITRMKPLTLNIYTKDTKIYIVNTFQKKHLPVASTSTGQKNITDRYALLTSVKPVFMETKKEYIVELPLIALKDHLLETTT